MSTSATGQRTGQGSTSVRILDESKPPLDLTVTAEHLELLNLSTLISRHSSDRFNLSFSIMLLGLYFGSHRISGWFRRYVDEQKVDVDSILEQQSLDRKSMDKIVSEGAPVVRGADGTLSMRDSPRLYPHTTGLSARAVWPVSRSTIGPACGT